MKNDYNDNNYYDDGYYNDYPDDGYAEDDLYYEDDLSYQDDYRDDYRDGYQDGQDRYQDDYGDEYGDYDDLSDGSAGKKTSKRSSGKKSSGSAKRSASSSGKKRSGSRKRSSKAARRRRKKIIALIMALIPVLLVIVILVSGFLFLKDFLTYRKAINEYDSIKELIKIEPNMATDTDDTEETVVPDFPTIEIDYDGLAEINPDFAGVLYIPALDLFYPMAYSHDNSEYLSTTFEGTKNPSGCIFVDCNANPGFTDLHTFIFGHNMKNETMFGSLKEFSKDADNELVRNSPYFFIFTKEKCIKYQIFAYYTTPVNDPMFDGIKSDDDYMSYVNRAYSRTMYKPDEDIDFSEHPNIVTLSTCWGTGHQYDFEVEGVMYDVKYND